MALVWILAAIGLAGCESDVTDHTPPAGQGSLIVDNRTSYDLDVYLDGRPQASTGSYDDRAYDLKPGTYRLVLDQRKGGSGTAALDLDILEGRRTLAEVHPASWDIRRLDVILSLD